jgi:hypothetical protein
MTSKVQSKTTMRSLLTHNDGDYRKQGSALLVGMWMVQPLWKTE